MRQTDIAIVGGGMAGSMAAVMLQRAGHDALLIDPHEIYPPDFRCEKLDESQVALLEQAGLADEILAVADRTDRIFICRHGRLIEKRPARQYSAPYDVLVNRMRSLLAGDALLADKVTSIKTSDDRQVLTFARSEPLSARLVVLANGLNKALRTSLGFGQDEISPNHSISIGFDMVPAEGGAFPFRALTYFPDDLTDRIAYLTLFPFGNVTRGNLFVYRDLNDPWLQEIRRAPVEALRRALPNLERMTGPFAVEGAVQIRPATLYVTTSRERDGLVLVGDAAGTSCPAAGTGLNKVFTDVGRLCQVHIPNWLATPGMAAAKTAAFYDDPVKTACDAESLDRAMLARNVATKNSLPWWLRRQVRYVGQLALGRLRQWRNGRADAAGIHTLRRT